jgi:hypothetical protein
MDWPLEDPKFSEEDLDNVFAYEPQNRTGICRFFGDEVRNLLYCQDHRVELSNWIQDITEQSLEGDRLSTWLGNVEPPLA